MTSNSFCPDPPGCDWVTQTLNGVTLQQCDRCGQVRMDRSALQQLASGPPASPVITDPIGRPAILPPPPVVGSEPTPAVAPLRYAPTIMPPDDDEEPEDAAPAEVISTEAPPPRPPTPRPTPTRSLETHTVVDFDSVEDAESEGLLPPRRERPPTPPPALRGVVPVDDAPAPDHPAGPEPLGDGLQPLSAALDKPHDNATWAADDVPTTVDATDALGLRAAITRSDEPELGLTTADPWSEDAETQFLEGETEELERFFTDEAPKEPEGGLLGAAADEPFEEDEWDRRRSPWPTIALVAVVLLLVTAGLGIAAVAVMPDLQAQLGLADADPGPDPVALPDEPELADPEPASADPEESDAAAEPVESDAATETTATPADPTDEPMPDPDTTEPEPAAVAAAEPEPALEPVVAPVVKPEPTPEPTPRVAAPPTGYAALVRRGWDAVEGDANTAADHFRGALDAKPGDTEASYGLGYAMLKLGQRNGARAYLCAASKSASGGTKSEIDGILSNAGIGCE